MIRASLFERTTTILDGSFMLREVKRMYEKESKTPKMTLEVDHDNVPEYNDLIVDYIKHFLDADGLLKIQNIGCRKQNNRMSYIEN